MVLPFLHPFCLNLSDVAAPSSSTGEMWGSPTAASSMAPKWESRGQMQGPPENQCLYYTVGENDSLPSYCGFFHSGSLTQLPGTELRARHETGSRKSYGISQGHTAPRLLILFTVNPLSLELSYPSRGDSCAQPASSLFQPQYCSRSVPGTSIYSGLNA